MRIGIDLDNTLVCYDALFRSLATERGWLAADFSGGKEAVRDAILCLTDGDERWQELQAEAYGLRIREADLFPGAAEVLRTWHAQGHEIFIISHKTRKSGKEGYDLHRAARDYLEASCCLREGLVAPEHVTFCETRAEKLRRIGETGCSVFVDDLSEVFLEPNFPKGVRKIHFVAGGRGMSPKDCLICSSWDAIGAWEPAADSLAKSAHLGRLRSIARLPGGRNSGVWKCETDTGATAVLKRYPNDKRRRLEAESAAFTLLRNNGLTCVPEVLGVNLEEHMALYSLVPGLPPKRDETPEAVMPFVRLIEDLFRLGRTGKAQHIGEAAEACRSLRVLESQVQERFVALAAAGESTQLHTRMRTFLCDELEPAWQFHFENACRGYASLGREPERELGPHERVLSPSDLGWHNALCTATGDVSFVDFEYFGWDDPVKLVSDFLLHPGMRLTAGQKEVFRRRVLALFAGTDAARRLPLLLPLFAVKWACILLNVFLPVYLRRGTATVRPYADEQLAARLEGARAMLRNTEHQG